MKRKNNVPYEMINKADKVITVNSIDIEQRRKEFLKNSKADFSGITPEMVKRQYKANLKGLQFLLDKARRTGKKANGYTEQQLVELVEKYKKLAE